MNVCITIRERERRVLTGSWAFHAIPAVWRVMTGGHRRTTHLERFSQLLLTSCSHFVHSQRPPMSGKSLWQTTSVHVNTMTLPPSPPHKRVNEVFIKMAAPSIDTPPSCIPQCNLHSHALVPFFVNNRLLDYGCICVFKGLLLFLPINKKLYIMLEEAQSRKQDTAKHNGADGHLDS